MALTLDKAGQAVSVDWSKLDHILLDMDGTLLDLNYDNDFWGYRIHEHFAAINGCTVEESITRFEPIFEAVSGTLDWYCTDHWSRHFGFSIIDLSQQYASTIRWRFDALAFLKRLHQSHLSCVMVTNAHPDIVAMKQAQTSITDYFDDIVSSHDYGDGKESQHFWRTLQTNIGFDPKRTLFIDDSAAVIDSAIKFGIGHTLTVSQPDTELANRTDLPTPSICRFGQIMTTLPAMESP